MEMPALLLLVTQLALPAFFILWLWVPRPVDRVDWLVRMGYGTCYLSFLTIVTRWDWIGTPFATLVPAAFALSVALSLLRVINRPWTTAPSFLRAHGLTTAMAILFLALTARALSGYGYDQRAVDLDFPLAPGTYYVAQGGAAPALNHHNTSRSQRYALDIVALDRSGRRARGLRPADLSDYVIFDRQVLSPCNGVAVSVHDGKPDDPISRLDTEAPDGNHVVLACGSVRVLLAHLAKGSILVNGGAVVKSGQPIGRVGNSGNTTEPILHIHAYEDGTRDPTEGIGVPMIFDGRFLVRGSTVTVPPVSP